MQTGRRLSGLKKIAVLILALGPQLSSKVLRHFNESEIERISLEVANTSRVKRERLEEVLDEFCLLHEAQQYILNGGIDYARDVLERTLGPQKAAELMKRLKETSKVKPFTFVRDADIKQLSSLVGQEHPQTIAYILSYLDSDQAAMIVSELPEGIQSDIARRIAIMERTSPQVLKGVESVMRERLSTMFHQDFAAVGGIPTIVEILNHVDRSTEKLILEELEKEDAELAEQIRQQMFIFEDVITLDDASIQRIIRDLDSNDIALALKGASDDVKNRIFKNVSRRAGEMLRENMEYMGPVRLREVEEAQQRVVEVIRRLDESGEIIISRGGEDAIVI
ncbi:MAG: flagellar motor switch protein FliG [Firmicutes bacterium]|nr:flagellar motor switch protein FliG [Bacillota bacterium]